MDSIFKSLSDPGAWVSGILFSLIAAFIYKWFGFLPGQLRGMSRARRLRGHRRVRKARENTMEITYAIGNANAQYVAFLLMSFFYLGTLLISEAFRNMINQSIALGLFIAAPIFGFELVWLFHDSFAQRLVREHGKLLRYRSRRNVP